MKIGLLADVHANLPALQAVLDDMPAVDALVCAGDIVGYNPMPAECVELVGQVASAIVQGNHDRAIETPDQYRHNEQAYRGLMYAKRELSQDQRNWLTQLPLKASFGAGEYLVVHSHPERTGEYVFQQEFPTLRPYLDDYSGIVLGHTHHQEIARFENGFILNPGSVGQPRDTNPKAAYGILDTEKNEVELRRTPYDIDLVYHEIVVNDLPEESGRRLFTGE